MSTPIITPCVMMGVYRQRRPGASGLDSETWDSTNAHPQSLPKLRSRLRQIAIPLTKPGIPSSPLCRRRSPYRRRLPKITLCWRSLGDGKAGMRPCPICQRRQLGKASSRRHLRGIAAAVVALAKLSHQHLRIPDAGLQPLLQIRLEWLQIAHRSGPRPVDRPARGRQQISADRLAVIASQPADRPYAQSFPLEFLDLIHVSTSKQCRPSSASRIGPVAHRRRVVDFSTSIMGIFASAVTYRTITAKSAFHSRPALGR